MVPLLEIDFISSSLLIAWRNEEAADNGATISRDFGLAAVVGGVGWVGKKTLIKKQKRRTSENLFDDQSYHRRAAPIGAAQNLTDHRFARATKPLAGEVRLRLMLRPLFVWFAPTVLHAGRRPRQKAQDLLQQLASNLLKISKIVIPEFRWILFSNISCIDSSLC